MWTLNEDYDRVINDVWKTNMVGCPMFILDRKLKILKSRRKDWSKSHFGNIDVNVKNDDKRLKEIKK